MVLDAAYFTEDKTITCTVTFGYSTLTASATADTVCKLLSRLGTSINVLKAFSIDDFVMGSMGAQANLDCYIFQRYKK